MYVRGGGCQFATLGGEGFSSSDILLASPLSFHLSESSFLPFGFGGIGPKELSHVVPPVIFEERLGFVRGGDWCYLGISPDGLWRGRDNPWSTQVVPFERSDFAGFVACPICAQERRGCPSPSMKVISASGSGGQEDGSDGCRVVRKRQKNWAKLKPDINYTLGEDIAWGQIE